MIQEVAAIIDRSGSMAGKESDTIGGINTTINELKKNKTNEIIKFSLKFFDNKEIIKIKHMDIENVHDLKVSDLVPRGQTALLDAMGKTISYFINKKICEPDSYESCIIYVATDGFENCSKKYDNDKIKNLIQEAKKYMIEVLYLGANQDAIFEASKFGLSRDNAMNYSENHENVNCAYRSLANAAKRHRTGQSVAFSDHERSVSIVN